MPNAQNQKRAKLSFSFLKAFLALVSVVVILVLLLNSFSFFDYLKLKGIQGPAFRADPSAYIQSIIKETPNSFFSKNKIADLNIDIKFKDWQTLSKFRDIALKNGIIDSSQKKFINGNVLFDNQESEAKIRLKGDWTDHLLGEKWSLRFKLEDNNYFNKIRKFSLQSPTTRDFQGQLIIDKMLKEFKILTPHNSLVNANINGEDIGIMFFSEHFSKELIESSNRRESVIIKFDESDLWASRLNNKIFESNEFSSKIVAFDMNKIIQNPKLMEDYKVAVGLLRGFLNGSLKAHEVFDVKLFGDFLAINDLWGESHGLIWHNLRFYFNPITSKLEPIGFDQMLYHNPDTLDLSEDWIADTEFISKIRKNGYIKLAYINTLRKLKRNMLNSEYLEQYIDLDNEIEEILRSEFFLKPPPLLKNNNLIKRLNLLIENSTNSIIYMEPSKDKIGWAVNPRKMSQVVELQYPDFLKKANLFVGDFYKYGLNNLGLKDPFHGYSNQIGLNNVSNLDKDKDFFFIADNIDFTRFQKIANSYYYSNNNNISIEIQNLIPFDFQVYEVKTIFKDNKNMKSRVFNLDEDDLIVPSAGTRFVNLEKIDVDDIDEIIITFSSLNGISRITQNVQNYPRALSKSPVPESTINHQLNTHNFLTLEPEKRVIVVQSGEWFVKAPIIVPSGYSLQINQGTSLNFDSESYILSHGNLQFFGAKQEPIILNSLNSNEFWKGIKLIGNSEYPSSVMNNVIVKNTTDLKVNDWILDAGFFVYKTNLELNNFQINNNKSEDSINIFDSKFSINGIQVANAKIDGLDIDFSTGNINGGSFTNIGSAMGGDAIDFSGSNSEIYDISIYNVDDKGLSIGEESYIYAKNIDVNKSSIGVAIKDGSFLEMHDSTIHDSINAIWAYIKKNEYKSPSALITNIKTQSNENFRADDGSSLIIDGSVFK